MYEKLIICLSFFYWILNNYECNNYSQLYDFNKFSLKKKVYKLIKNLETKKVVLPAAVDHFD